MLCRMCGRIGLTEITWRKLVAILRAEVSPEPEQLFRPRYNLAPTQGAWICRQLADGRKLVPATWGFPSHAGHVIINARAETASSAKSFKKAFAERRCLVPASGFYEWSRDASHQPYWFTSSNGDDLLLLAGLFREGPAGLQFVVVTTAANGAMRPIHHRMPVVLSSADADAWLEMADESLLRPAPDSALRFHPVSRKVNSVGVDGPECLAEATPPRQLRLRLDG